MKPIFTIAIVGALAAPLVFAKGSFDDAERMLQVGTDYGITHFQSIEFDDDYDDDDVEIEGWIGQEWFVEFDLNLNGDIEREQRQTVTGDIYGLTADEVRSYLNAARQNGMERIEEFNVDRRGRIEIDGEDDRGRDLELDFGTDSTEPTRIDRDR